MPTMRTKNKEIIALVISDIHLSSKPPLARLGEKNWWDAQKRYLDQVNDLRIKYGVPIFCCGDIFDKWNAPAQLINFAIEHLPNHIYSIPGNHDLPFHVISSIKESAYYTLIAANKIKDLSTLADRESMISVKFDNRYVHPFPYGAGIEKPAIKKDRINIAIVHKYIHKGGETSHPQAVEDQDARRNKLRNDLKGYDLSFFGDNHKPFQLSTQNIYNCGCLIPRRTDEKDTTPSVLTINRNLHVRREWLDTSEDVWLDVHNMIDALGDSIVHAEFIEELRNLGEGALNFIESIKRGLDNFERHPRAKRIIKHIMEALDTNGD